MWVFRLVVANLLAGLIRPIVWAALFVLAMWFVVTVPARLWLLYVDAQASAATLSTLNWVTGVGLGAFWLAWKTRAVQRGRSRRRHAETTDPHRAR
jgi:hypothetical protein